MCLEKNKTLGPQLCDECSTDADCGISMTCDVNVGTCGCAEHWSDADGNAATGCEEMTPGTPEVNNCPRGIDL